MSRRSTRTSRSSTPLSQSERSSRESVPRDPPDLKDDTSDSVESSPQTDNRSDVKRVSGFIDQYNESPCPPEKRAAKPRAKNTRRSESPSPENGENETIDLTKSDDEPDDDESCTAPQPPSPSPSPLNGNSSRKSAKKGGTPLRNSPTPSPPLTIEELESEIKDIITEADRFYTEEKPGHVYVFADPDGKAPHFKIGQTNDWKSRQAWHRSNCKATWKLHKIPSNGGTRAYVHLEKIAHTELTNLKYNFECLCGTAHKEYFLGEKDMGLDVLRFWARWMKEHSPYDENINLSPFWAERLKILGGEGFDNHRYRCPKAECQDAAEVRTSSCQACLRLRLQAWTEPTRWDKFYYELLCIWRNVAFIWTFICDPKVHLVALFVYSVAMPIVALLITWERASILIFLPPFITFFRLWKTLSLFEKSQSARGPTKPQTPGRQSTRKVSVSPTPAKLEVLSDQDMSPSITRSRSISELIDDVPETQNTPKSSTPGASKTEMDPKFLTPERPRSGTKRRKSHN
ncbi:hypothetical protein ASPWEDRAFT_32437 [Aspergillus wentii DTO 134E9]|uniref:Bacteriophage T5 Orf172 DNA-binding domain-containing protein n=1 Tax=Aspergillus wentii DTO 134E9 TaxID=1073089 RepID=A0A1L9R5S7_ASPWE|nr:uncharacterized protein ASPWEDRAFT_32437 [Aspergillus wentii DTO 134E9]KAI9925268.1 hypothetical protein MW887_006192 [Aspergillus wentii]OJJ30237.1 hypothetical protein ASPWEDRAFT_32437 [Aspergillus wentii DTO 134E9]